MTEKHHVLIVEDDPHHCEDLELILDGLGFTYKSTDNRDDAIALFAGEPFCFVLLDLQIRKSAKSIRSHATAGHQVLREVRTHFPARVNNGTHELPVIVVSGYAREADPAVEIMRDGADDLVQKPITEAKVRQSVSRCLNTCGRRQHVACAALSSRSNAAVPASSSAKKVLTIPGTRTRKNRRTLVAINGTGSDVTNASLRVLLRLIVARLKGEKAVHKSDLGYEADKGYKTPSRLNEEMRAAAGVDVAENMYHGEYRLDLSVEVGHIDTAMLLALDHQGIKDQAQALADCLKAKKKV